MRRSTLVSTIAVVMLAVPSCSLATGGQAPLPGARYLLPVAGSLDAPTLGGAIQIGDDGHSLTSTAHAPYSQFGEGFPASYLTLRLRCGRSRDSIAFGFGAPKFAAVAIGDDGRFSAIGVGFGDPFAWKAADASDRIRLVGQFGSNGTAIVRISGGRYHLTGRRRCAIPHRTVRLKPMPLPTASSCAAAGKTVAATSSSRVFTAYGRDEFGSYGTTANPFPYVYACSFGGRIVPLGPSAGEAQVEGAQLAGRFVSYQDVYFTVDFVVPSYLVVVDLGSGQVLRDQLGPLPDQPDADSPYFASNVVTEEGSVAWIGSYCISGYQDTPSESGDCILPGSTFGHEVWIADAQGQRRVAEGTDIDEKSLSLQGSAVTWTRHGVEESAPIDQR